MSAFKGTPGPWEWETTPSGEVRLQTPDRGKLYVMGFSRRGMQGAQPRFSLWGEGARDRRGGIMHDFADAGGAEHPDARLIAAAPDLLDACQTFAEWLRREDAGLPAGIERGTPDGERKWREWWNENLRICDLAQKQAVAAIAKATGEQS